MSDQDHYPDHDHVRRFGDDEALYRPEDQSGSTSSGLPLPGATPRAVAFGIGIGVLIVLGIALAIIVLVATGCKVTKPVCVVDANGHLGPPDCVITTATEAQYKQFQEKVSAERLRLMKQMHGDMSKEMREHRMP